MFNVACRCSDGWMLSNSSPVSPIFYAAIVGRSDETTATLVEVSLILERQAVAQRRLSCNRKL
jgi:hypothetical protein